MAEVLFLHTYTYARMRPQAWAWEWGWAQTRWGTTWATEVGDTAVGGTEWAEWPRTTDANALTRLLNLAYDILSHPGTEGS